MTFLQVLKSKTVWYAILVAVLSVLQGFVMQLPVSPATQAVIGCAIAAGIVIFRLITTLPIASK